MIVIPKDITVSEGRVIGECVAFILESGREPVADEAVVAFLHDRLPNTETVLRVITLMEKMGFLKRGRTH